MKFIVAKCHSMRVAGHSPLKQIKYSYSLHTQTLEQVMSAKYLGITITDNLDWGQHVSDVLTKATQTLDFLRRNLALAPRKTKDMAYNTLVRQKAGICFSSLEALQQVTGLSAGEGAEDCSPLNLQALAER